MTRLAIRTYPDPVLAKKAEPVAEITPEISQLMQDMVQTMYESDGVGLAAPQVGHALRLITIDETGPKERKNPLVILNPVLSDCLGAKESEESCLSLPTFTCTVKRNESLTVRGKNEKGEDIEIKAEGLLAVILQHECDHLEGKTLVNHASRLKRTMYDTKVKKWKKD
jgi:peptide deformylase